MALALASCAARAEDGQASYGPLYERFKLTLEPGERIEAVSPLWYWEESGPPNDRLRIWAAPPLFSYARNDDTDFVQLDMLWKLATYNRYGTEYRFQLLQWFNFAGGATQSATNVSRFTLFPIYFQQRSALPELNYTALLPIHGRITGRFFRDEIKFTLFPLYGQSRKKDVVTDNYLFPFFHLRHGDGLSGWQFWPLMGAERKEVTTRTNKWGDLESVPGHDKLTVLWPFFHDQRLGQGSSNGVHQQALLPLYSYYGAPRRHSISVPWPIGFTRTVDEEKQFEEWGAPWPLIVFARGEGKHTDRVWPFYSRAENKSQTSAWYAWPIYKYNRLKSDPLDRERTRILFFLYSDTVARNTEDQTSRRRVDLWPLFTAKREMDGRQRVQFLAPLEPILPNSTGVERDLSPLWSFWRAEKNPKTGASSQSLLWNLYRRERTPESRKCSLLFGLFKYQSGPDGKRWRVLYIPFGKRKEAPAPP